MSLVMGGRANPSVTPSLIPLAEEMVALEYAPGTSLPLVRNAGLPRNPVQVQTHAGHEFEGT